MRKDRDTPPDPQQPALIVTYGNTSRKRRPLDKPLLVLGRMQGCDLALMSPDVAPVHCVIVRLATGWRIRDCSGHLGTRVNGKAVTDEALADEDHLQIGPFNFKVHLPPQPKKPEPAPVPAAPSASGPDGDASGIEQQKQSRSNLIRLALSYRAQAQNALRRQDELQAQHDRRAGELAADKADLDRGWQQLEEASAELQGRERHAEQAEKALREKAALAEQETRRQRAAAAELTRNREALARDRDRLDAERQELDALRARHEAAHLEAEGLRCQVEADRAREAERRREAESATQERRRELDLRAAELDAFAAALRRDRDAARAHTPAEVARLLQEVETLRRQAERPATVAGPDAERVARLDEQVADLTREADRLRAQLKRVHEENELLKQQQQAPATVPLDQLVAEQQVSDHAVDELTQQVDLLKQRLVEVHLQHDVERQAFERQIRTLQEARPGSLAAGDDHPGVTEEEMAKLIAHVDLLRRENAELHDAVAQQQNQQVEVNTKARTIELLRQQLELLDGEMARVRGQLDARDAALEDLRRQVGEAADVRTLRTLRESLLKLEDDLKDRDALIEKLSVELDAPTPGRLEHSGSYERELHQFRLELERDRRLLSEQLEEVRQRQHDVAEAARETELQLSRERASLARERHELTRMREEIRVDQERLERLAKNRAGGGASVAEMRDALAPSRQGGSNQGGTRRR